MNTPDLLHRDYLLWEGVTRRFAFTFRSLKSRNYRLYFIGQGISLIGTWMQRLAMSWLVYRLTQSSFYLGATEFASQFSAFLLMPFAGALLDRWDIRRALVFTQALGVIQALLLAILTISGHITFEGIIVLSVILGVINAFDMPARQTFTIHLVERKEDLSNAIGLNSAIFNLARLLGPSLAGLTIAALGEGPCFLLNGLSFIPILIALKYIKPVVTVQEKRKISLAEDIREGCSYAMSSKPIRTILLELTLISLVGMPYVVLLPVIAKDILHGGPATFGFLMGAFGIGALIGALFIASRAQVRNLVSLIPLSFGLFGLGFGLFAVSQNLPLSLLLMAINGFSMVVGWSASNTVLQLVIDDDKRSRVMSLYVMSFMGAAPIGSLTAGWVAEKIGAPTTLLLSSGICFLVTLVLSRLLLSVVNDLPPKTPTAA